MYYADRSFMGGNRLDYNKNSYFRPKLGRGRQQHSLKVLLSSFGEVI